MLRAYMKSWTVVGKVGPASRLMCQRPQSMLNLNLGDGNTQAQRQVSLTGKRHSSLGKSQSVPSPFYPLSSLTCLKNLQKISWILLQAFTDTLKSPTPIQFTPACSLTLWANAVNMFPYHSLYWLNRCIQLACLLGSCNSILRGGQIPKQTPPQRAVLPTTKCWSHCLFPSNLRATQYPAWLYLFNLCLTRAQHDDVKPNAWESVWHILLALKKKKKSLLDGDNRI